MSVISASKKQLLEQVEGALERVRPHLAVDGGDVELVEITDENVVVIRWLGACQQCNMTQMTLKAGIEEVVKGLVPEIDRVEAIEESIA